MDLTWLVLLLTIVVVVMFFSARHVMSWIRFLVVARKIPGPKSIPWIGNVELLFKSLSDALFLTAKYIEEHPRFFSVWFGPLAALVVVEAEHVETVLGNSKHVKKPFYYRFSELGNGLFSAGEKRWHSSRRLLNPTFNYKILEKFVPVFERKSEVLVKKLEKEVGGNNFDIHSYICKCMLDIIYETALGTQMNALEDEERKEILKANRLGCRCMMERIASPWLYPDFIYWRSPTGRLHRKCVDTVMKYANEVIRERLENQKPKSESTHIKGDELLGMKERMAFLDLVLEVSRNGNFTNKDITDEVATFIVAGFETTSSALCWTVQLLGNHLDVQEKVAEELQKIFQGSDRASTLADLNEMKYLERVIKESLRLYSAAPIVARILKEDVQMDGSTIPKRMLIVLPIYYIHRNPKYFPEPEMFDPDRFLPERVSTRHPYAYVPFCAGPRNCIGQKFAMLEMKMVLAGILRRYKVRSMREKLTPVPEVSLAAKEGFYISLSRRNVS